MIMIVYLLPPLEAPPLLPPREPPPKLPPPRELPPKLPLPPRELPLKLPLLRLGVELCEGLIPLLLGTELR